MIVINLSMNKYTQLLVLFLLGILIYSNTIDNQFVFDDIPHIQNNSTLKDLSSLYGGARWFGMYTFKINYYFHELNVKGYHIINIIIHILNSFLVLWMINLVLKTQNKIKALDNSKSYFAFLVALFFIAHPIQTQAVTYIIQRLASLACMFYLLVLILYLKARETDNYSKYFYSVLLVPFLIAGIFTKETMYTIPLIIFITEIIFFQNVMNLKNTIVRYWSLVSVMLLILISSFVTFYNLEGIFSEKFSLKLGVMISQYEYLITQFQVIFLYLRLLVIPVNQMLDYIYPISYSIINWKSIVSLMGLVLIGYITKYFYKKGYKLEVFGILWFFITISIESSIIPLADIVFEHRLYLPSIGYCILLASLMNKIQNRYGNIFSAIVILIIITTYSIGSYNRNLSWDTAISIWTDNIIKSPSNPVPYWSRAKEYFKIGKYGKAIDDYTSAIDLNSNLVTIIGERGLAYEKQNMFNHAISDYSKMADLNKNDSGKWYRKIGVIHTRNGDYNKALVYWNKSIFSEPCYYKFYISRGITYQHLGNFKKALEDFKKAIFLNDDSKEEIFNYAGVKIAKNDLSLFYEELHFCKSN
tara:strand:+ start:3741 stop:5498 length:1758 start_codon:yes stop_codon:yes gene_type:complete